MLSATLAAALVWALYNAALTQVFAFGPAFMTAAGLSLTTAGAIASATLWLVALTLPLGGMLADRTGRHRQVIAASLGAFALLLAAAPLAAGSLAAGATGSGQQAIWPVVVVFALLGIVGGIPAGVVMSLPGEVLSRESRALGMGLFFMVFYVGTALAPIAGGAIAAVSGDFGDSLMFGAALSLACLPIVWWQGRLARRAGSPV